MRVLLLSATGVRFRDVAEPPPPVIAIPVAPHQMVMEEREGREPVRSRARVFKRIGAVTYEEVPNGR